jgi:hypothetical protein
MTPSILHSAMNLGEGLLRPWRGWQPLLVAAKPIAIFGRDITGGPRNRT